MCLNSKTYFCYGADNSKDKLSAKGVKRTGNLITAEMYLNVLDNKAPKQFINRGFMNPYKNESIHTYEMIKNGLTWFYGKRQVQPDGVSTKPLTI